MIDLVDDAFLELRLLAFVSRLPFPIADRTVALVGRLSHLVEVQVADVDIRGVLVTPVRILQAVIAEDAQILLVLTLVPLLDRLRCFDR